MIQKMNFSEGYFMNVQIMSTPRKSIFQDITQVIVIKQTIEHDF